MKEGKDIYSVLAADGSVSALVGTRIHPVGAVPQNVTKPYLSYERIVGIPQVTLTDWGGTKRILEQINCYATDRPGADDLADKAMTALFNGFKVSEFSYDGTYDEDTELYGVSIDMTFYT